MIDAESSTIPLPVTAGPAGSLTPTALTPEAFARLLSAACGKVVTMDMVQTAIGAGAPADPARQPSWRFLDADERRLDSTATRLPCRIWLIAELLALLGYVGPEGRQRSVASGRGTDMFEWIAGILTVGLLAYLAVALLKPEWFA